MNESLSEKGNNDMKAILYLDWTIGDICKGFQYNEYEGKGLYGLSGRLTIQPEFQRHYLYAETSGTC